MKIGDTVYTVNAKTNDIDEWIFNGYMIMPKEPFCQLVQGEKFCCLPKRCVFKDKYKAYQVAHKKQIFLN